MTDTGTPGCDYGYTGTDCGYNVDLSTGEMAHMYYSTLGNPAAYNTSGVEQWCITADAHPTYCLRNDWPFYNLTYDAYPEPRWWSGTPYAPDTATAWHFGFLAGFQGWALSGERYHRHAWAVRPGDIAPPPPAVPYVLVGFYRRIDDFLSIGGLNSLAFKAGAAQGCPNNNPTSPTGAPTGYKQPCYIPNPPDTAGQATWLSTNGIIPAVTGAGLPTWTWNGETLTETGLFWATSYIGSNPNGTPIISDKVMNLTINPAGEPSTQKTNAAAYECVEGLFLASVGRSGCENLAFNSNQANDSTATWNVGGNSKCVTLTIGGDDYSLLDGSSGTPGNPAPRGLTFQFAGWVGAGCAETGRGLTGFDTAQRRDGAFDLWYVIRDDSSYLILANSLISNTTTGDGCYLFGAGPTSPCGNDQTLLGASYLVLAKDADGDGIGDPVDNCPSTANTNQLDTDN